MKGPTQDTCVMIGIYSMEHTPGGVALMVGGVEQSQLVKVR